MSEANHGLGAVVYVYSTYTRLRPLVANYLGARQQARAAIDNAYSIGDAVSHGEH